jgi:putative transposase
VGILTGEVVGAQTVSQLTRDLDQAVRQFHQTALADEWAYLFLDGVSLRVRRRAGRQRVQMLVAYGVRRDGTRQLHAFLHSSEESRSAWEGLLGDLYRRGLRGQNLLLIVIEGCAGTGGGDPDGLHASAPSALLGTQDAEPSGNTCASAITTK